MSVPALIAKYGKTMTLRRPTFVADSTGHATASTYATTSVRGLLQVGGGSTDIRWGGFRGRYSAVCYFTGDVDVRDGDEIAVSLESATRTYRIESVRTPDERSTGDPLRYRIVGLEEDLPRV